MRILLTGGSGMLGRNLKETLDGRGHYVIAPRRSELDLLDQSATLQFMRSATPDLVVHAAGKVGGIAANMADQAGFLRENTELGFNVVRACAEAGVSRLINVGSSCMYPRNRELLAESDLLTGELEPTNEGYALAKISVAKLAAYFRERDSRLQYSTLIFPNLFGPFDHFDAERSHMIPAAIRKVHAAKAGGDRDVVVWGDGTARREFMFVVDAAEAIARLIAHLADLPTFLNVGIGRDRSVLEYYQAIAQVIGYERGFEHDTTKPVGMTRKLLDSSRVRAICPLTETPLLEGIESTYRYFLSSGEER